MRINVGLMFVTVASIVVAGCVGNEASSAALNPDELNYRPAGGANEVMVLASPHLSQLPDSFHPEMVEPLVVRLAAWSPAAVASENISGVVCDFMRRNPARYIEAYEYYCFDPSIAGNATGLDVPAANAEAESMLANWPLEPKPALRRRLAAVFLAAGEPASALVQWLRLPKVERNADGALTPELADLLNNRILKQNETELIAAQVAAMAGLERVWSVDDQTPYMGPLDDPDAYGAALSAAWDNPATKARSAQSEALEAELDQADGLLKYYRALNDPSYAVEAYASDWGPALAEPSLEAYGRRYVAYWEARNLRMVANIREVLGRQPGTRMLVVVGASHKGYYEAYLGQMRDVEIIDIMPLLK